MTFNLYRPKNSQKKKKFRKKKSLSKKIFSKKGGFLRELFTNVATKAGSCSANDQTACDSTNKISQIRQQQQSDSQFDTNSQPVSPAADNTNQTTQGQSDADYSNQQFQEAQKNYCSVMSKTRGIRCGGRKRKTLKFKKKN